jgi:NAD(P)-dependent dehydrogenase (short-subunit alcohol dehydrogenase family)
MALPYLEKTNGNIINFGSMVTERSVAGEFVYNSTKGAVKAMTKAMAGTWGKKGVRVNLIQPGIIETDFNIAAGLPSEIVKENYDASKELNELPLTGTPEDVVNAAIFLASDQARFITGINFKVDGGISLASIRRENAVQTT